MFCSKCGNPMSKDDQFCKSCGNRNQDYKENNTIQYNSFNQMNSGNINTGGNINNNYPPQFNKNMNNDLNNDKNSYSLSQNDNIRQLSNQVNSFNYNQTNRIQNQMNEIPNNLNQFNHNQSFNQQINNLNHQQGKGFLNKIKNSPNKKLYFIVGIVSLIAIVGVILVIVKMTNSSNGTSNNQSNNSSSPASSNATFNLGGSTYQVPNGYNIISQDNGCVELKSSNVYYLVSLKSLYYDYYKNNLEQYNQELRTSASNYNVDSTEIVNVGGREYLLSKINSNGYVCMLYATTSSYSGYVFVGIVSNYNATYDKNSLNDLSKMLDNPISSGFSAPTDENVGFDQIFSHLNK